jgi:hypothetical protein
VSDEVSTVSGSFVDPLKLKPARLSLGAIHHLKDKRYFPIHPSSPLQALLSVPCGPEQKHGKELTKLGIPAEPQSGVRVSGKGRAYLESLIIAGAPEARLEYAEIAPGGERPIAMDLVLGGGKAAMVDLDQGGLSFSPAMLYSDLVKPLVRHVHGADVLIEKLTLRGEELRTVGWVFRSQTELPRAECEARLVALAKLSPKDAATAVNELVAKRLLIANGPALALNPPLKAYVERAAQGSVIELMLTPYDAKGKAGDRRELRFIGPPKDRIAALTVKEKDGIVIALLAVSRDPLRRFLESFMGLS